VCLLVKILKFGNIRFVGNLIGDIHWNFYDDDFIIVTSAYRFVRQKKKLFLKHASSAALLTFSVSITLVAIESVLAMSTCLDWSLLAKGS